MLPRWSGKTATAAQLVYLASVVFVGHDIPSLFAIAATLSGIAAVDYLWQFRGAATPTIQLKDRNVLSRIVVGPDSQPLMARSMASILVIISRNSRLVSCCCVSRSAC